MTNPSQAATGPRTGSIYDLGYRHYDGPRRGRAWAMWSLYAESFRGIWGFGRPFSAKAAPFILGGLYAILAFFQLAFSSFISRQIAEGGAPTLATYDNYFGAMSIFVILFCVAQAPEVVCRDQRYTVLPLYFTRTIGRIEYASARLASLVTALFIVAMVPNVALFVGDILMKTDTFAAIGHEIPKALPSIPATLMVSLSLASISLTISSFTPRRAYAAVGIVAYMLLMEAIPAAIYGIGRSGGGAGQDWVFLVTPITSLQGATAWFFGAKLDPAAFLSDLSADQYLAAAVASMVLFTAVLLIRYRRVSA